MFVLNDLTSELVHEGFNDKPIFTNPSIVIKQYFFYDNKKWI